jgi:hypothetical protein
MLHSVDWLLAVHEDCSTFEDGTDRLSRNVGNDLRCVTSQKSEGLKTIPVLTFNCVLRLWLFLQCVFPNQKGVSGGNLPLLHMIFWSTETFVPALSRLFESREVKVNGPCCRVSAYVGTHHDVRSSCLWSTTLVRKCEVWAE